MKVFYQRMNTNENEGNSERKLPVKFDFSSDVKRPTFHLPFTYAAQIIDKMHIRKYLPSALECPFDPP